MKRLFWDLETSPDVVYSWRVGHELHIPAENIVKERAIICVCWKWEHERAVESATWNRGDDKELLRKFAKVALAADELVAQNGDKFDVRWLNTRTLFHGLPPLPQWKTVDTLWIARKRFYFNSNRLDYMGRFLGVGGKIKTDFSLWKKICEDNDQKAMAKMVRYCKRDVLQLQRVWEKLAPYHQSKSHAGVAAGRDKWSCPHDGSENVAIHQRRFTAAGTRQTQMQCKDCGKYYMINDKTAKAYEDHN